MVDFKYADLFIKDNVDKQLKITSDDGLINITNTELHQQQFELTESLCSEKELTFGACEASTIKFTVSNVFIPMKGKWITPAMVLDGHSDAPFRFGRYKVYSDVPTADRTKREIIAYDAMYDIINADMSDWYESTFPTKNTEMTMREFRRKFISHFGLQEAEITLVNDSMVVEKTVSISESKESENTSVISTGEMLSGKDIIRAICEINGCFGHIGRDGKFHYIYLLQDMQGLYPANFLYPDRVPELWDYLPQARTGHLYPQDPKSTKISKNFYITCKYEDFHVRLIDKLQVRKEENDIGAVVGNANGNGYIIENNFLVYGKNTDQLRTIANNIFNKITDIVYRPFEADCKGNPCFEVGDPVSLSTKYDIVESYILKRTLKGIQALRDTFSANGEEYRSQKVNSVNRKLIELKGRTNTLTRTVDETRSELKNTAEELSSEITQTATDIRLEVKNTKEGLESQISQTATEIRLEVNDVNNNLSSKIEQTAEQIKQTVSKTQNTWDTRSLPQSILSGLQTSYGEPWTILDSNGNMVYPPSKTVAYLDQSTGIVYTSAGNKWNMYGQLKLLSNELGSQIEQNADSIRLKVDLGDVSNQLSIEKGLISIEGNRLKVDTTNFQLSEAGEAYFRTNLSLGYETATELKPGVPQTFTWHKYVFAETSVENKGSSDLTHANQPFLEIKSPNGTTVISIGRVSLTESGKYSFYDRDSPLFRNGAVIEHAFIASLQQTYTYHENISNGEEYVTFHARVSGVFVSVYGTYYCWTHKAGENKEIVVGNSNSEFVPKHHTVRTCAEEGKRAMTFRLSPDGKLTVRNASSIDIEVKEGEDMKNMGFRFDFFRF